MVERRPTITFRFRPVRTLCAFLLLAPLARPAQAPPAAQTDDEVKAAYLLNFGRFLRHSNPPAPRSSFDICLLGPNPIGHGIDDVARNESINNLPVHIRRLPDVTDAKACDILYIATTDTDVVREDLALLSASDALTVSDASTFLDRGGMIQFSLIENHVRFSVNLNAVSRAHLVLSSELLRVASSIIGKPPAEDVP